MHKRTKAFLDNFSYALREELCDTRITLTCLMPGVTETEFFRHAEMLDAKVGTHEKADPAKRETASRRRWTAMWHRQRLEEQTQVAGARVRPPEMAAKQHTATAEPDQDRKSDNRRALLHQR